MTSVFTLDDFIHQQYVTLEKYIQKALVYLL